MQFQNGLAVYSKCHLPQVKICIEFVTRKHITPVNISEPILPVKSRGY